MRHVTEITRWYVTLNDGTTVEVWADGYQELDGPSNPDRLVIALAQFPVSAVAEIRSA